MSKNPFKNNPIQRWLQRPIFKSKHVYIDRWSLVHFSSGAILGYITLVLFPIPHSWIFVFALLIIYELWEQNYGHYFFIEEESWLNIYWDLIVGMAGYGFVYLISV